MADCLSTDYRGLIVVDLSGTWFEVLEVNPFPGHPERLSLTVQASKWPDRTRFGLTPREQQVAALLASRASNAEIASQLGISVHTARRHTERVFEKLNCQSRSAVRRRLLQVLDPISGSENARAKNGK